ncbi:unnamed protein product [Brachionus calyciflorus]|uniref:Negative elongation factor D n=1 Tax=Brachionus calyciflorus TaxID=104777 RepID=A0A814HPZ1_9BILA|nr:unnamed protein product [Brachionus calyciflorus]
MEEDDSESQRIQNECKDLFASTDYIMEPAIFDTIKTYFMHGGEPSPVVDLLSESYTAVAQTVNLLADWLISLGTPVQEVQQMVENHLKNLIMKNFDPKKADTIFTMEGGAPNWLTEIIEHSIWRKMLFKLAEQHPNCLMLNFTIKLISDSGYEKEINSVAVASQQVEVYSKVLKSSLVTFVKEGIELQDKNLQDIIALTCRGEHTYLYSQMLLNSIFNRNKLLCNENGCFIAKRISQEIDLAAKEKNYNITPYSLALNDTPKYPRVMSGLDSMLTKNSLNTSDITNLYKLYSSDDPPPVHLIRNSRFLDMLISYFFEPSAKLNPEHKDKYLYLLAYASSVCEIYNGEERLSIIKNNLDETKILIQTAYTICHENKASSDLLGDLNELFKCLVLPVVAIGVLKWVELIIIDPSYFKLNTDGSPIHLILLDEIAQLHPLLHSRIFTLLNRLFLENFADLDNLVQIQFKKTIIDRMIFLMGKGYVVPILAFLNKCWKDQDTDISLIRHFVMEVLEMIGPPYSQKLVSLFLPLINNEYINTFLKADERKIVQEFLTYCKENSLS